MPAVLILKRFFRVAGLAAILVCISVHAEEPKGGSEKSVEGKLLGTWTVVSAERDGKLLRLQKEKEEGSFGPFFALRGDQIVFSNVDPESRQRLSVLVKRSRGDLEGSCWLEGDNKPQTLRMLLQPVGANWRRSPTFTGIFALAPDRLKICFSTRAGAKPPQDFQTKEGADRVLIHLERSTDKPLTERDLTDNVKARLVAARRSKDRTVHLIAKFETRDEEKRQILVEFHSTVATPHERMLMNLVEACVGGCGPGAGPEWRAAEVEAMFSIPTNGADFSNRKDYEKCYLLFLKFKKDD